MPRVRCGRLEGMKDLTSKAATAQAIDVLRALHPDDDAAGDIRR
jgi:hypothetical protein